MRWTAPLLLLAACAPVQPPAPTVAEPYRALGTEPFWALTIDGRRIVFTEANAPGVEIAQPTPRPIHGFAGDIYLTPRIHVNTVHGRCSDGMSDRVYPDSIQLTVDGRAYRGCGGSASWFAATDERGQPRR